MNYCEKGSSDGANNGQGVAHKKDAPAKRPVKESDIDVMSIMSNSSLSSCVEVQFAGATVVSRC